MLTKTFPLLLLIASFQLPIRSSDTRFSECHVGMPEFYPVPQPNPVKSEYLVGVFACNFWHPDKGFPYHTWMMDGVRCTYWPILGRYNSGDPFAWDWQIKWASEHGIGFFVIYWYWRSDQSEPWKSFRDNLVQGLLRARYINYTRFALCVGVEPICNMDSQHEIKNQLIDAVDDAAIHFFGHSQYLQLDGKPVVFVGKTEKMLEDFGVVSVIDIIQSIREAARRKGTEVKLINVGMGNAFDERRSRLQCELSDLFDGNAFHDFWAGAWQEPYLSFNAEGKPVMIAPYDLLVDAWLRIANEWRRTFSDRYVPSVAPGFNNSGWYACPSKRGFQNWLCVRTDGTAQKFLEMCESMKAFATRRTNNMMLVKAWDEFGEGHSIQPSTEYGFSRLEVVRQTFASDGKPHADSRPAFCSLGVIDRLCWDDQGKQLTVAVSGTNGKFSEVDIFSEACPRVCILPNGTRVQGKNIHNGTYVVILFRFSGEIAEIVLFYGGDIATSTSTTSVLCTETTETRQTTMDQLNYLAVLAIIGATILISTRRLLKRNPIIHRRKVCRITTDC